MNSFEFNQKKIEFDEERERISSIYKVINIRGNDLSSIGEFKVLYIYTLYVWFGNKLNDKKLVNQERSK